MVLAISNAALISSSGAVVKNKVCIVTGAASGIGKAIAITYAREGGKVAIADLKRDAAQAVADKITKAGGTAMALVMDAASEEQ